MRKTTLTVSATQREYPYFRPLNLNAGAMLTGSGDGKTGGRRGGGSPGGPGAGGREAGGMTVLGLRFSPLREPLSRDAVVTSR